MQITNNNINKEKQQQNKSYSLTPKMRCMQIDSPWFPRPPRQKAPTSLTSVSWLNIIAPLQHAHSQTSFWQASFQYLLHSHILLMKCVHTRRPQGIQFAQQICKFQTYQFFRVFGPECQPNLRGDPSFLPLADKKMNRRKQARLDF